MKIKYLFSRLRESSVRSKLDSLYGIGRIEKLIYSNWFNPLATLWINFRSFPIKQAILLPIWVYGRPRLYCLSGKMIILSKPKSGMIKFNIVKYGAPGNMDSQTELYNLGKIEFFGKFEIGTGNKIVTSYGKTLTLGDNSVLMDRCCIAVHESVSIGDNTTIAHNCQIMDTNYHFIADMLNRRIPKRTSPIKIGSGCWVCNSSSIMMGSCLPDYAIIASHSVVNQDFSDALGGCIIAGIPAKIIKKDCVRVFNSSVEKQIWSYFRDNDDSPFPINDLDIEELVRYK